MLVQDVFRPNSPKIIKLSEVFFCLGLLIAIIGAGKYWLFANVPKKQAVDFPSSIIERRLAVTKAGGDGTVSYNFSTNFIPGIGIIVDPRAELKKLKTENDKLLNSP